MQLPRSAGFEGWKTSLPLALGLALLSTNFLRAVDWPNYRGPTHDGVSTERINKNWSGLVTNAVWRVHLTNGLTSLTVSSGRVFTQVAADTDEDGLGDKEYCVALNATNGVLLWSTEMDASGFLYPNGGVGSTDDGPRSTPVLAYGSVYVLSTYLKLYRLNPANGSVIWSTNLVTAYGGNVIPWQNAASPVLENGLLFVNAATPSASLMAFNATNGALIWRSQNEGMTHSTPVLATIHGVRQLIWVTQSGLVSVNPMTGALIWKFNHPFGYSTSLAASPAVYERDIFLSGFYGMGAYAIRIENTNGVQTPFLRWSNTQLQLQNHWSSPVCFQGAVVGQFTPDNANAQLKCINLSNGRTNWVANNFGRGSLLLVGTNLLCITERGSLVLVAAQTNAYQELARFEAIPGYADDANKCWNAMALSDGQLYIRSTAYAARYDLSVPDLKLDAPQLTSGNKLNLTIRTATGNPVDSNRLASMEVRASTNLTDAVLAWPKLTNVLTLSNGVVRVTNVDASPSRRLFIISEPK